MESDMSTDQWCEDLQLIKAYLREHCVFALVLVSQVWQDLLQMQIVVG